MELRNAFKTKEEFEKNHTFTVLEEKIKNPEEKAYTVEELNKKLKYVLEDRTNIVQEKKEKEQKESKFNRLYQRYGISSDDLEREIYEFKDIDEKELEQKENRKKEIDKGVENKDARSFDERI